MTDFRHDNDAPKTDAFEQQLQRAMRRATPPADLQAKFYAMAADIERKKMEREKMARGGWFRFMSPRSGGFVFAMPKVPVWATGALAATLVAGLFAAGDLHLRHAKEQQEATREYELARQIEARTLAKVDAQIAEAEPKAESN